MSSRTRLLSTASAAVLSLWFVGAADAGGAAVSAPNGDASVFVGTLGNDVTLGSTGSFSVPLSSSWGAQIDGMLGMGEGAAFYGVGGHLFTRDPAKGLLGLYANYVGWDLSSTKPVSDPVDGIADITGANVGKVGVEGEAYLGRISLEGLAGYQFGTATGFAGRGVLAWYATDNLRLSAGYNYLQSPGGGLIGGVEWAPAGSASLFVNAAANASSTTLIAGVKAYFGGAPKSLIRREREDDPSNTLPDDLYSIVGNGHCPVGSREISGFCDANN
jgi:hypothetical protein